MCNRSTTLQHFINPESSLTQESSTGPYHDPDQSSLYHFIPSLQESILILFTHLRLGTSNNQNQNRIKEVMLIRTAINKETELGITNFPDIVHCFRPQVKSSMSLICWVSSVIFNTDPFGKCSCSRRNIQRDFL
jgi:hypothetical protein